jgi:hypothetical protein
VSRISAIALCAVLLTQPAVADGRADHSGIMTQRSPGPWHRVTATWYGPGFYGNRTACGHRYSRWLRGIAHRTLPCGTRVEIRWHGRRVVTRVVDRGPYPRHRRWSDIDLTARTSCWDLMPGGRYGDRGCFTKSGVRWRVLR